MAQNPPVSANHPDLEQETAPAKPVKRSPLFGISRARIKSLDVGVQRTLQSTFDRWVKNRIEFIESLPEDTRQELLDAGELQFPVLTMPGSKPPTAPPAPARRPEPAHGQPMTGFAGARVQGVAGYGRQG